MERLTQSTLETSDDRDLMLAHEVPGVIEQRSAQDSPSLAIMRLLWQHRIRLRKAALISLAASLIITLLIPNSYDSGVRLMPPDSDALSGGMASLAALMSSSSMSSSSGSTMSSGLASGLGELLGGQRPGAIVVGIIQCRTVADRLIDQFDLRKVYRKKTYLAARKELKSRTEVQEDKKTGIIEIKVSDHDRARSAAMAQAYVAELNQLLSQVNNTAASRERAFLEQRLASVHQELDTDAKNLSQFSSKNVTLDLDKQSEAMVQAAAVLQGQLIAAQSELSGLEQIYTSENVRVRSLRAHVAELQQQLDKVGGQNYTGATTLDPHALYPSLRQLPVLGVEYAELYRRVKIDETVLELLTKEYELARVEEAKQTPSVKVLDAPLPPEKKSWPPRTLLTILGTILGLVVGGCWIVAEEFWMELDPRHPHKEFAAQVWNDIRPVLQENAERVNAGLVKLRFWSNNSNHSHSDESQ